MLGQTEDLGCLSVLAHPPRCPRESLTVVLMAWHRCIYDFRVTVRRITGDGRKQISYNVFVDELRDGRPYRGKAYLGGYGERWIDQFEVRASGDFPQAYTAP
jgi:hypothetical protein